jgi:predicted transglutaminase-like cysteine proteinase
MHALTCHPLSVLGALTGQLPARLISLLLAIGLGWTLAQSGLDRMQLLAQQRYGAPAADTVGNWHRMLEESRTLSDDEKLKAVNLFFNRRIYFNSDQAVWGVPDHWATPLEFMGKAQGDCEDFAIAKYISLLLLGVPNDKLRLIYVRARFGSAALLNSEAHMVLGYYADPAGDPVILDSLLNSIRPAAARADLVPIFSFNTQGLWVPGTSTVGADPTARLSRWRDVLDRIKADGIQL